MNKKIMGFCGYRCDLCPAYVKNVDILAKKTTIRKGWNTFFGFDVPEKPRFEKDGTPFLASMSLRKKSFASAAIKSGAIWIQNALFVLVHKARTCRTVRSVIVLNPVKYYLCVQTFLMR